MSRLRSALESPNALMLAIMLVGLFHGGLYASFLPPWGLVDEEQHVHYIQSLAEQREIPVVGTTYLSQDIVDSLFETRRWEVFHWPTPQSRDPREMGFEGHSYQGYQPPLYYAVLAPIYAMIPGSVVAKVYALRWAGVLLSLVTVWTAYRISRELLPRSRMLPYSVCLILVLLPERAMSIGRVNNDVLLEVIAAGFVWACVRTMLAGLSTQRSLWMGALLGLGLLTKTSMAGLTLMVVLVFWANRRRSDWMRCVILTGGLAVVVSLPLLVRNQQLYGDWTGLSSFLAIRGYYDVPVSMKTLSSAIIDLFRHFWAIWWKGAAPGSNLLIDGIWLVLAALCMVSVTGLIRLCRQWRTDGQPVARVRVVLAFLLAIVGYGLSTLAVYFSGVEPVMQGRFLLPVVVPIACLFGLGLSGASHGKLALGMTCLALVAFDLLSLFGNLLPYFYFWSMFVVNGVAQPQMSLNLHETLAVAYPRFVSDKPAWLHPLLAWLIALYVAALAFTAVRMRRLTAAGELERSSWPRG